MHKKLVAFTLLSGLAASSLYAYQAGIEWTWQSNDPKVVSYRYQIDGEDPEGWTVIKVGRKGQTYSAEMEQVDFGETYSLYLQQTYDGVNWSGSSIYPYVAVDEGGLTYEASNESYDEGSDESYDEGLYEEDESYEEEEEPVAEVSAPAPAPVAAPAPAPAPAAESNEKQKVLDNGLPYDYYGYLNSNGDYILFETYGAFDDEGYFVENDDFFNLPPEKQNEFYDMLEASLTLEN